MAEQDDKTEDPTGKRLSQAREKGQIGKSSDLSAAVGLIGAAVLLLLFGEKIGVGLSNLVRENLMAIPTIKFDEAGVIYFLKEHMWFFFRLLLPLMLVMMVLGVLVSGSQVGFIFTMKPLKPNFLKVFSIDGFKRIISPDKIVDMIKSIFKMCIVGLIGYQVVSSHFTEFFYLVDQSLSQIVSLLFDVLIELLLKCGALLLVLGLGDLIYQKFKTKKSLKMSKQEVKDEAKQSDGDPFIKSKLKALRQEMYKKMMMNEVPNATVVVTNPTYIAIAIRFKKGVDKAPVVLAKGKRLMAEKIRRIATENEIPIVENKPLARGMYDHIVIGEEIPEEFFAPLAEILAYVYRLKSKESEFETV